LKLSGAANDAEEIPSLTALIFGASGQDGFYLEALLREKGFEPICLSRSSQPFCADVADFAQVEDLIRRYKPDLIFHLAANSSTRHDALFENHRTIETGTLNILESVKLHSSDSKVFIAGSGLQFRNNREPIDESRCFAALSPYAVSRIQSTYAARYYRTLGLRVYVGFLFHHESPRRKPHHVSRLISDAAKRSASGSDEKLTIGDARVVKEWTFAGDVARAMLTLVGQDVIFEAIIGSGEGHSIQEWVELCFGLRGLNWKDHVQVAPSFKAEYDYLVSAPTTIRSLGWTPQVKFEDLASMMMRESS
jgi:GDPmannose 4,6-dehydratase